MRRSSPFLACVILLSALNAESASSFDPNQAAKVFSKLADAPELRNPSVELVDVSTGQVIFQSNAFSQRKPASTLKILSAVATLKYFDPASSFATSVSIGTEENSLVINGDFDPWISMNNDVATRMNRTSFYRLAQAGLRAINKNSKKPVKKFKVYYNGIYSNEAVTLKSYYKKKGFSTRLIEVTEKDARALSAELISYSTSPTVKEIMDWYLTWSDNLLAERMARLAAKQAGNGFNSTGVRVTFKAILKDFGIDSRKLVIRDASGLSRDNKVTANILSTLLVKIHSDLTLASLIDGLPVSGKSGTLLERYIKSAPAAVGLVKAKTGTLSGTVSLAGFVQSKDREYAFVVIADRIERTYSAGEKARKTIDKFLGKIAAPLVIENVGSEPDAIDFQIL